MDASFAIAYVEAWKIQEFNGVWTRDLAIPVRRSNQLSYEATENQLSYDHNCEDHIAWFHIRSLIYHIFHAVYHVIIHSFIPHGLITTHKWPSPNFSGHGFKPRWSPDLFRLP